MELDFSKMKWRIDQVPLDREVVVFFPALKDIFLEFIDRLDASEVRSDLIIRYIIYCYHQYSPLISIEDIMLRKKKAMLLAGAELVNNEFPEQLQNVMMYEIDDVCLSIIQFLKFEKNVKHMALTFQVETFFNWHMELVRSRGRTTEVNAKKLQELQESIDTLSAQFFSGDKELVNFVPVHQILRERTIITPEQYVAIRKAENKKNTGLPNQANPADGTR